jgi:hypothetical protein
MVAIPINIKKKKNDVIQIQIFGFIYYNTFGVKYVHLYHCPVFCAMYHLLFSLYRLSINAMKTEGAIQNRQFIDTCNIGHKTQNKDKKNRQYNTENKKMSNTDPH